MLLQEVDESDILVSTFRQVMIRGEASWQNAPNLLKRILKENRWRHRVMQENGKDADFDYFEEFVQAEVPRGLEATIDLLMRLCGDDKDALNEIDKVLKEGKRQGARTDIVNNGNEVESRPVGNTEQAAIRRLRKERPDLLKEVKSGTLTAHAAMVKAGFRKRSITIPSEPSAAARAILRHFKGEQLTTLIRELLKEVPC